jgi:hypothetical protein
MWFLLAGSALLLALLASVAFDHAGVRGGGRRDTTGGHSTYGELVRITLASKINAGETTRV